MALLLALLLAAPLAQAGWLGPDPVEVRVAPFRVGDQLRYEATQEEDGEAGRNDTLVLVVEGASRVVDHHGVERPVDVLLAQESNATGLQGVFRCHALQGGAEAVRMDPVHGWGSWSSARFFGAGRTPLEQRSGTANATLLSWFGGSCPRWANLGDLTLREGERVDVLRFLPEAEGDLRSVLSQPAAPTDFHGRAALAFRYDLLELLSEEETVPGGTSGVFELVVADGLPGIVRLRGEAVVESDGTRKVSRLTDELAGFVPGDGAAVPAPSGAKLPKANPAAEPRPYAPLALDDAAFRLPYAYAQALADARGDPMVGLDAWLAAHPDARLVKAAYRLSRSEVALGQEALVAAWSMTFASGDRRYSVTAMRGLDESPTAPLTSLVPRASTSVQDGGESTYRERWGTPPAQVASSGALAAVAAAHGVPPAKVVALTYDLGASRGLATARLLVSDVACCDGDATEAGRRVELDVLAARAKAVYRVTTHTQTTSVLPLAAPPTGGVEDGREPSALAFFAGPAAGAGLGGGAAVATGVAVLLLLLKFLAVPLFTRLRRARVLDNPVRARLYERIRAEPGIHLGELTDFGGVGSGATRHHLAHLRRHGYVVETRAEGYLRYFATGEVPPEVARRETVLRAGSNRAVYDLFAAQPHLTLREAGARLGLSAPTVHRAKKRLEKEGLLPAARPADVGMAQRAES